MSFQTKKGEKEKERGKNGKNRGIGLILISKTLLFSERNFIIYYVWMEIEI